MAQVLTIATIAVMLSVAVLFLRTSLLQARRGPTPPVPTWRKPRPVLSSPNRMRLITLIVSVIFAVAFVASVGYQSLNGRPVDPSDFADFRVLSDGSFSLTDQFRADILSFRWVFHGTGRYSLHPNGTSGILFDTAGPNGTAYIENGLSADQVSTRITFRVESLYGTQRLILFRANSSWLGVIPSGGSSWMLAFFDGVANRSFDLGTIGPGWYQAKVAFSPLGQEVEAVGTRLALPPTGPIRSIDIGHTDNPAGGGGSFVIGEVAMQWSNRRIGPSQVLAASVIVTDLAVLTPLMFVHYLPRNRRPHGS